MKVELVALLLYHPVSGSGVEASGGTVRESVSIYTVHVCPPAIICNTYFTEALIHSFSPGGKHML
jgi:hypothetical protein